MCSLAHNLLKLLIKRNRRCADALQSVDAVELLLEQLPSGWNPPVIEVLPDPNPHPNPNPNPDPNPNRNQARLLPAMPLPRAALLLLHWLHRLDPTLRPTAIISNDWVAALTAPYARHPSWTAACAGSDGAP